MTPALLLLLLVFSLFCSISLCTFPLDIPKTLYVYWDTQIPHAPMMVQLCVQKMKTVCQQQKWTFVILNQTNLHQYIPNYTDFMQVWTHASHPDWKAPLTDLVRLNVLAANGGVYMDITTILTQGLAWLDKLDQVPYLLANSQIQQGVQPDCILPYLSFYQNSAETRDSEGRITNWLPGYEIWFFATKKNSNFIQKWRLSFQIHFQQAEQINRKIQIQKGYFLRNYWQGDYLNGDRSAVQIIQEQQFKLDEQVTLFGERKNANKELKILGLHGEFGPMSLYLGHTPNTDEFLTLTLKQIEQKYYAPIRFFVKLTNQHRNYFDECLNTLKHISQKHGFDENVFDKFLSTMPSSNECKTVKFIVQGSVFGILIQNNKKAQMQQIFAITVAQRDQWHKYCKSKHQIDLKKKKYPQNLHDCMIWLTDYDSVIKKLGILIDDVKEQLNKQNPDIKRISQILEPFLSACRECMLAGNWMGLITHPAQTIYWQKRYQNNIVKGNDLQKISMLHLTSQALTEYQETQLFWVWLSMLLFQNRIYVIGFLLVWTCLIILFSVFSLTYIMISFVLWSLLTLYKYNIRPIVQIFKLVRQFSIAQIIKKLFSQVTHYFKDFYQSFSTVNKCFRIAQIIVKIFFMRIYSFAVGLAFLGYNTFILYEYIAIFINGKIFHQEWIFFLIILGQILLRNLCLKSQKSRIFLPGISFKLLYYVFLPFYYYSFGSSVLSLAQPSHNNNFIMSFYMAFCLPLIIKLLQHESGLSIKKIINASDSHQDNFAKRLEHKILHLFIHLTDWIQKLVLIFLIVIMVSNLQFMRDQGGYILVQLFELVSKQKLMWVILSCLYCWKSFIIVSGTIKKIQKPVQQSYVSQKDDEILQSQKHLQSHSSSIATIQTAQKCVTITSNYTSAQTIKPKLKCIRKITYEVLSSLLMVTKYTLRSCTIYTLLFNDNIDRMMSRFMEIKTSILIEIICMKLYFFIVFLGFMVEIYLEGECFELLKNVKEAQDKKEASDKIVGLTQSPQSVNDEKDIAIGQNLSGVSNSDNDHNYRQADTKNDTNSTNTKDSLSLIISACLTISFIVLRLLSIINICQLFNQKSIKNTFNFEQYFKNLILIVCSIFIGYLFAMVFILNPLRRQIKLKAKDSVVRRRQELVQESEG